MKSCIYYIVSLVALVPLGIQGLVEEDVRETTCSALQDKFDKEPIDLDLKWMGSIDKWYVPLWSKLHAYRIASDMLDQDMSQISESVLGTSCILMNKGNLITAHGKEQIFEMKGDPKGLEFKAPAKRAQSAKFTFKLTDNYSYILGINCWEDDQVSWAVLSTTPTLRLGVKNLVMDYIKVLGLKKSLAQTEDYGYGSCKGAKKQEEL